MVNVIINGRAVKVPEKTTILEAAEKAGVRIPTLCYLKDLNEIGACRICVVEVEGYERLFTACNNPVADGMVIHTNSKKASPSTIPTVPYVPATGTAPCRRSPMT